MFPCRNRVLLFLCLLLFLTGCWDGRNIEEISLSMGVAFDKAAEGPTEESDHKKNLITMTLQEIIPQPNQPSSQQGGNQPQSYQNVTVTGDSILELFREISLREDRPPFAQHLKVVVIGEELARDINLEIILSLFSRTFEVRDSTILLIAKGSAADTLNLSGEIPAFRLFGIKDNQYKNARILPATTLGKTWSKMTAKSSFIVQGVSAKNGNVKFNSGAIIKGNTKKLAGFLNGEEVQGLNLLMGKVKGGVIKGRDEKTNQLITYEIRSLKSKIIPHIKGKDISFDVNILSEGMLNEDWVLYSNAFDNQFIKRAERAATKEMKRQIKHIMHMLQKEYQADVAGFGEQLRIHYPKVWEQVKKNWDQTFSQVPVSYKINITIQDYMLRGKKEISDE